jgi:hypothetical protein
MVLAATAVAGQNLVIKRGHNVYNYIITTMCPPRLTWEYDRTHNIAARLHPSCLPSMYMSIRGLELLGLGLGLGRFKLSTSDSAE